MKLISVFCFACFLCLTASSQDDQRALLRQADSLMLMYKFEGALRLLENCDSTRTDILLRISQCNFRLGINDAAIHPLKRVLETDSMNVAALNLLGQLYSRNGDYQSALDSFETLIGLDSTNSFYYKQAGAMASKLENDSTARVWFSKALRYNPGDVESSVALANILMEMEDYESVDKVVRLALALAPTSKPILILQARSGLEQQQYRSVIITVNTLLQQSDTTILYARLLGESYFQLQEYDNLINCMLFLLKNRYQDERLYYCMGVALREKGDAAVSIPWFERAAQESISANTMVYYTNMGQSYEALKKYRQAINAYRTAYNYSKDPILFYHLGRNYDMYYKEKQQALEYYRKYIKSDDTTSLARKYVRRRMQDLGDF